MLCIQQPSMASAYYETQVIKLPILGKQVCVHHTTAAVLEMQLLADGAAVQHRTRDAVIPSCSCIPHADYYSIISIYIRG